MQNQIFYLEDYIGKHPELELIDVYADNGRSGMNFERAAFRRMMEDVKSGVINCIVVKDLSRFGRNHIEAGYYLETIFPELDVRFISVNDSFDSMETVTQDGMTIPLKNIINEMYARDTQRKVLATLRAQERKGERPFTAVPYGYMVDPECNYHLLPDVKTAEYVSLIFTMYAGGMGTTAIADRLNEMGAPTPLDYKQSHGKYKNTASRGTWNHTAVRKILKNRTYTGATIYNTAGKGEYRVLPDTHKALTDKDTFEAIGAKIEERGNRKSAELKKGAARAERYPNILRGIFYCADCGHAMLYDRTGNSKILHSFRYRCGNYSNYRKNDAAAPPCAAKIASVPEQTVYKFVIDRIREQLAAGFELEKSAQLSGAQAKERQRRKTELKKQEADLKQEIAKLYENYKEAAVTEKEYTETRRKYQEQMTDIQDRIAALGRGDESREPWKKLKNKLFAYEPSGETAGIIQLSDTSSVEIVADDETDAVERLLRRGLTSELLQTMVERLEYSADGNFSIKLKCEDYVKLSDTTAEDEE